MKDETKKHIKKIALAIGGFIGVLFCIRKGRNNNSNIKDRLGDLEELVTDSRRGVGEVSKGIGEVSRNVDNASSSIGKARQSIRTSLDIIDRVESANKKE